MMDDDDDDDPFQAPRRPLRPIRQAACGGRASRKRRVGGAAQMPLPLLGPPKPPALRGPTRISSDLYANGCQEMCEGLVTNDTRTREEGSAWRPEVARAEDEMRGADYLRSITSGTSLPQFISEKAYNLKLTLGITGIKGIEVLSPSRRYLGLKRKILTRGIPAARGWR